MTTTFRGRRMAARSWIGVIAGVLAVAQGWAVEPAATTPPKGATNAATDEYYDLLRLFVDTLDQVERNYVQDISRRELVEAAIQGMLSKLDQHTNYISPKELDQFRTGVESEFGGIGIHVMSQNGELRISGTVVASPAYRAGLVAGDVITHVGDKPLKGLPIDEAIRQLKGKPGTTVEFTARRAKDDKVESMKLTREIVRMETVTGFARREDNSWNYWVDSDKRLAYVRVSSFARHTTEELSKALTELKAARMAGLILDLRFNPGGLLSSAIEVCDMFIDEGRIVSTSGRNVEERHWDAHRRGTFRDFPMAVLINRASASASEIVAACLQDHHRAIVVGERSWGKGSVQNVVELEGGHSAIKLTTAKYYRPSGKDIHRDDNEGDDGEWGVTPDDGHAIRLNTRPFYELSEHMNRRLRLFNEPEPGERDEFVDRQLDHAIAFLAERAAGASTSPESKSPESKSPESKSTESKSAESTSAKSKSLSASAGEKTDSGAREKEKAKATGAKENGKGSEPPQKSEPSAPPEKRGSNDRPDRE